MKKQLLFLLIFILSFNSFSQISFDKGYFIDNTNRKTDCLIKNMDWKNNPTEFEYKLSENSEVKKVTIKSVKEFSINNISKYIRNTVKIDRSSEKIQKLSEVKKPIFKEEELFLKVLVEGKSNLYQYVDGNLIRYFYNKENFDIDQLIFKSYKIKGRIGKNNRFRQQLWADLKCPNFKMSKIESVNYNKNDLMFLFIEYSECFNDELIIFEQKPKRDLFNFTIRPRLNSSSLTLKTFENFREIINFDNETGFGFGLEVEFILPVNRNKWAIAIEPTYQNFKSEKTTNIESVFGGKIISKVDYSSIEIPIGLRHYFFLNKSSKLFVNTSFIFDLISKKSSIELTRDNGSNISSFEIDTRNNFAMGIGYKQNDRYGVEIRYQTGREIIASHGGWNSDYKTFSIIFGYTIF